MLVLVTGASGFVGSALVSALAAEGVGVRAAYRARPQMRAEDSIAVGDLSGATDWSRALEGVTHVVHCAGPAHRRTDEGACRREIVEATEALAAQAEAAGVSRFVYLSSVKAAADRGGPFTEADAPHPETDYGRAKLDAECRLAARPKLAPVSLRPPLVFAPNAKANFRRLLQLVASPAPLPLGGIENCRSLISLPSLIEAIRAVLWASAGAGAYFVADTPAISTARLVTALRAGMGRSANLIPGPRALLPRALTESFEINDTAFRAAFAFAPPHDVHEALQRCGAAWARR
jgi:UDP-glucose 4-epimerase